MLDNHTDVAWVNVMVFGELYALLDMVRVVLVTVDMKIHIIYLQQLPVDNYNMSVLGDRVDKDTAGQMVVFELSLDTLMVMDEL